MSEMKKEVENLIIDLKNDYVSLKNILGKEKTDYYGDPKISQDTEVEFRKKYNFSYTNFIKREYKNIFIVLCTPSLEEIEAAQKSTTEFRTMLINGVTAKLDELIKSYGVLEKVKKYEDIFIIDYHDRAVCPASFLKRKKFDYSAVYKREYRTNIKEKWGFNNYHETVHPYPFVMFGATDPTWYIFGKEYQKKNKKPGCFWMGSAILHEVPEEPENYCDRRPFLSKAGGLLTSLKYSVSQDKFVEAINNFKMFLHLNGTANLCKRFFEGVSQKSLMIFQDMELVFPFEKGENFSSECCFTTPEGLVKVLTNLSNNDELYFACLQNQEKIVNKYYNPFFLRTYLLKNKKTFIP